MRNTGSNLPEWQVSNKVPLRSREKFGHLLGGRGVME